MVPRPLHRIPAHRTFPFCLPRRGHVETQFSKTVVGQLRRYAVDLHLLGHMERPLLLEAANYQLLVSNHNAPVRAIITVFPVPRLLTPQGTSGFL